MNHVARIPMITRRAAAQPQGAIRQLRDDSVGNNQKRCRFGRSSDRLQDPIIEKHGRARADFSPADLLSSWQLASMQQW
jgi:hypothetical protein